MAVQNYKTNLKYMFESDKCPANGTENTTEQLHRVQPNKKTKTAPYSIQSHIRYNTRIIAVLPKQNI